MRPSTTGTWRVDRKDRSIGLAIELLRFDFLMLDAFRRVFLMLVFLIFDFPSWGVTWWVARVIEVVLVVLLNALLSFDGLWEYMVVFFFFNSGSLPVSLYSSCCSSSIFTYRKFLLKSTSWVLVDWLILI